MDEFEYVRTILDNVTSETGDKFMASCPVHGEDTHPSLRVFRRDDGRAGFHCFAGCDWRVIRQKLGLPVNGGEQSSPEVLERVRQRRQKREQERMAAIRKTAQELLKTRPDITYHKDVERGMPFIHRQWGLTRDIVDELMIGFCPEAPLCRQSPSITFPYYSTDGRLVRLSHRLIAPPAGRGKYYPHQKNMPVALYNAPALNDRDVREIFLVEGEAKTAYVYQYFPAVGISGKNGFKSEWAELFSGRIVYVTLDPDALEQARQIAETIAMNGGDARVIELPDKVDDLLRTDENGLAILMEQRQRAEKRYYSLSRQRVVKERNGDRSYWTSMYATIL